ncbi:MAG: guanitoxin biosynthesis heme-dependent pre-guanitoxin N-hydroxylase GntA [Pontixanthobacter sp.]
MQIDESKADKLGQMLRDWIAEDGFPCVGAKSALARNTLEIVVASRIDSGWDDLRIHRKLLDWSRKSREDPEKLRSLAIVFAGPEQMDEPAFEDSMWQRIQSLADKDHWAGQPYDADVSPNPNDPHFSLSFGGEAYFVVGLHPGASRPARRFAYPTMIFNLHEQFERLREKGRYERMREAILDRDVALAGSLNPMLARHGESSEARQYSGRVVDADWKAPFADPRGDTCKKDDT